MERTLKNRNLNDWLEYIARSHPAEIEMGLERVQRVWSRLKLLADLPGQSTVVTVAGTNGKGSTIAMIEAGLMASGKRVGSYTSPHIHVYNERVKLDAVPVDDALLIESFEKVESAREDTPLTYFEFGTLSALYVLFSQSPDVICLEIGLGGRLDAVNIVDADIAVITSIALDHEDWLGSDIQQIGREKAGILRPNQVAFLGENLPESVYVHANALGVHYRSFQKDFFIESADFPLLRLPANNVALSLEVLKVLVPSADLSGMRSVIAGLNLPGRLERFVYEGKELFLDVGHNPHAAAYLARFARVLTAKGAEVHAVYSSLEDKDAVNVVAELAESVSSWHLGSLNVPRAMSRESLRDSVYEGLTKQSPSAVGEVDKNVLSFDTINEAIASALTIQSTKPVALLVFGSFFVVESARDLLNKGS